MCGFNRHHTLICSALLEKAWAWTQKSVRLLLVVFGIAPLGHCGLGQEPRQVIPTS